MRQSREREQSWKRRQPGAKLRGTPTCKGHGRGAWEGAAAAPTPRVGPGAKGVSQGRRNDQTSDALWGQAKSGLKVFGPSDTKAS